MITGWLITVVIRYLYKFTNVRAEHWTTAVVQWAHTHRRLAWLLGDLLESGRSPNRALLVWLLLLIGGAWLFLGILEDVVTLDPLVKADQAFYLLFQNMRGPLGDRLMVVLSELGDWVVVTAVTVFVALWLVQRRAWHDLGYWLAAVALAVVSFKTLLQVQRPIDLYSGLDVYSFPSGHATMSMVVYGFATVLGASELSPRLRVIPYTVAGLLITGIALSRIYLGAHWLSDVVGGLALGLAWVALLAIARQRHPRRRLGTASAPAVAIVLSAVWIWHANVRLEADLVRYAIRQPVQIMGREDWWVQGWKQLPAYRLDLEGEYEQPLNIQWAGGMAEIRKLLAAQGWREPVPLNPRTALRYLMPSPTLTDLPLLPQLHDGRYESLLMIRKTDVSNRKLLVLHLWSTRVRLDPDQTPVWIGTLAWLGLDRLPLLAFPVNADDYDQAVAASIWFSGYCFERPAVQQRMQKEASENPNTRSEEHTSELQSH